MYTYDYNENAEIIRYRHGGFRPELPVLLGGDLERLG
jgi:hypothetical protein